MTALGSRVAMTHRCTVQRLSGSANTWGADVSWEDHLTDQPCRAWEVSSTAGIRPGELTDVMIRKLALPSGTDVTTADRILDVTFRGDVVFDGPQAIDDVQWWPDRIEATLRRPI